MRRMLSAAAALIAGASAFGQSASPAVFVCNNGNLEGSVTSYKVGKDGSLVFNDRVITGTRPAGKTFHPGTNCQSITISPSGEFLAIGHGTSATQSEQLTIIQIDSDAMLEIYAVLSVFDSPIDVEWLTDTLLASTQTSSNPCFTNTYRWDPGPGTITFIDFQATGSFSTSYAKHPTLPILYANNSSGNQISVIEYNPMTGFQTLVEVEPTVGAFPLGLGVSPNGKWLYAGGGISGGGHAVLAYEIDQVTGALSVITGSPFVSPGQSPKQVAVTGDSRFAIVAHGTDATARVLAIDEKSGSLTDTGFSYDIGPQGSMGEVATCGDLVFITDRDTITDGVRGTRSFTAQSNGQLVQNGTIVDSQGISPWNLVVWKPVVAPPCPADLDGDGAVGSADAALLLGAWGTAGPGDLDGSGTVGSGDVALLLGSWGPCPA